VPAFWEKLQNDIPDLKQGEIKLPSGLKIRYPNLRKEGREWVYDTYRKGRLEQNKLYGGKVLENISQALAGEICKEAIQRMLPNVTGAVHDEIHVLCKKGLGLVTMMKLQKAMTTPPSWFPEIKLKAEIGMGESWGDVK